MIPYIIGFNQHRFTKIASFEEDISLWRRRSCTSDSSHSETNFFISRYFSLSLSLSHTHTCIPNILIFFSSMSLPAHSEPRPLNQFRNHYFTDGRSPWTSDQSIARPLLKHRTTQTQNKRIHTHTKHPFLKWGSNPLSQRPSEQRQFMS
jgi:hypothetical protein